MREWPEFAEVTCLAIACPSCMTLDLARSCSTYVTTIINGADLIPTVSAGQHSPTPPSTPPAYLPLLHDAGPCMAGGHRTFAPPPTHITLDLARSCFAHVMIIINRADLILTVSADQQPLLPLLPPHPSPPPCSGSSAGMLSVNLCVNASA